ncbi:acylphosphatase [bacterium]|nr:acylphosphatase [bacterium]
MANSVRAHVIVSGLVQGVAFRESTKAQALAKGVTGWVRNRLDGQVEAVFEGRDSAVQSLLQYVSAGPNNAKVTDIALKFDEPTAEFGTFLILRSA